MIFVFIQLIVVRVSNFFIAQIYLDWLWIRLFVLIAFLLIRFVFFFYSVFARLLNLSGCHLQTQTLFFFFSLVIFIHFCLWAVFVCYSPFWSVPLVIGSFQANNCGHVHLNLKCKGQKLNRMQKRGHFGLKWRHIPSLCGHSTLSRPVSSRLVSSWPVSSRHPFRMPFVPKSRKWRHTQFVFGVVLAFKLHEHPSLLLRMNVKTNYLPFFIFFGRFVWNVRQLSFHAIRLDFARRSRCRLALCLRILIAFHPLTRIRSTRSEYLFLASFLLFFVVRTTRSFTRARHTRPMRFVRSERHHFRSDLNPSFVRSARWCLSHARAHFDRVSFLLLFLLLRLLLLIQPRSAFRVKITVRSPLLSPPVRSFSNSFTFPFLHRKHVSSRVICSAAVLPPLPGPTQSASIRFVCRLLLLRRLVHV